MSVRRLHLLVAFAVISSSGAAFLAPDCAYACSCAFPAGSSPQELARQEFRSSDAVFAGEVIDIDEPQEATNFMTPTTVTFRVSGVWKGPEGEAVSVENEDSAVGCGYPFEEGEGYLVYVGDGNKVVPCGSTKPLSEAKADLAVLGPGEAPEGSLSTGGDRLPDTSGDLSRTSPSTRALPSPAAGAVALAVAAVLVGVLLATRTVR